MRAANCRQARLKYQGKGLWLLTYLWAGGTAVQRYRRFEAGMDAAYSVWRIPMERPSDVR